MLYQTDNPHGGDLYARPVTLDFSVNLNPLGTPPAVREAIARSAELIEHYPDPYCRALTGAIAHFEGVVGEHILCGSGAAELICAYCAAVRPRKALVPAPSFAEYETALASSGCEAVRCLLRPEEDFALTGGFLDALARTDADLVMLCNPNNPTGRLIPQPLLERIAQSCRERDIRLFVDECFLDLTEEGDARSLKPLLDESPGLFLLKAFTKSYGMAGARLGYCLCADGALLAAMSRLAQPWNVSLPAQLAGVAALEETDFLPRARAIIAEERAALDQGLRGLGFRTVPSDANFILFYSGRELKEPLLRRGILIRDCANFPGLGKGWYRVAVKLPHENARLLEAMKEAAHGA